jgi:HEAT repeat protein
LRVSQFVSASSAVLFLVVGTACAAGQTSGRPSQSANELVNQFKSESVFWKQFEVAKKIVAAGDKSVLPELEPFLSDEDMHVRGNAAFIFASLGDDRGFEVLKAILEDQSNNRKVYTVNDAGQPYPAGQIREDRYYAAHLFGDLKDPRALPLLIPLLRDKDVDYIVPWSLGQIGDRAAIPPLIEMLDDTSPDLRVLAIYALEKLDAKQALPKIRTMTDDHEKIHFDGLIPVSEAAREAIIKLEQKP